MTTSLVGRLGFADVVGISEASCRPVEALPSTLSRLGGGRSRWSELK
jgi:hypothetical protein